jgi:hypothetical protein
MGTRVISFRLPAIVDASLQRSTVDARRSTAGCLDLLLRHSFSNCQLLLALADCPDVLDAKLDVRIPLATLEQLRLASEGLRIPVSVYIRKLLYHFFVTKKLMYVQAEGHYTLAGRHD